MQLTNTKRTPGHTYYQFGGKLFISYAGGDFPYCTICLQQNGMNTRPFGKTFHGGDCLLQALESYKRATIKKAIRQIISDQTTS